MDGEPSLAESVEGFDARLSNLSYGGALKSSVRGRKRMRLGSVTQSENVAASSVPRTR